MTENNNLPLILEPEALETLLASDQPLKDNLIIIDLCNPQLYRQAHVPGAISVNPARLVAGTLPARGKLPPVSQLEALFAELGYTGEEHFIVYDDEGGGWAGRFIWTLDVIGHKHYSYLNGGIHAWLKEKHPVESQPNQRASADASIQTVSLNIDDSVIASSDFIIDSLDNPEFVIWDARSPEEYSGEKVMAQKAGHIPGAVNFEWTRAMDPQRNYRIKNGVESELAAIGINGDKRIITHCQGHHRSGFTYLVAKSLGFDNVRAYDGSWSEWGNLPNTPVSL
ncbi:rhodanese-like domain-containing protein [uncultured Endozoicomonas sp.]|uniref:sulfurtransferase n=1 Tax=uncultured Endozoicomonas sp. TaxID=432652 RepID=UPI00260A403A|nr:rhodanese-like domain-containing protein [uncultured Endozoicomonas sp.]